MTSAAPGPSGIAIAARSRRSQLVARIVMACLVSFVVSVLVGWAGAMVWLLAYIAAQLPEIAAFAPYYAEGHEQIPLWRRIAGCFGVLVNASAFAALTAPLWLRGGPWGGLCATLLIAAAMINQTVSTPGSRSVLMCSMGPSVVCLGVTPLFMAHFGAPATYQAAVAVGGLGLTGYAFLLWNMMEKSRTAEARARAESERKRIEAEAAVASKSIYVAAIGHDLRTPISAMLAGAIELEKAAAGSALRAHATLIGDAGRMMKTLLDDVLDHAKLEAGRMSIEAATFDLRALVAQSVRFWQSEARKKGLRVRVEGAAGLPRWVEGDPTRLRQILNNLISNAVKFTDKGSVSLRLSAWASADDGCAVRLQVVDTGEGMTPEQVQRLFQPFQQADKTVARHHGGTGLGLTISRQLAELMGGRLTVLSAKGAGSIFTLALTFAFAEAPANAESETAAPAPAESDEGDEGGDGARGAIRALVADDHEINRRAIELVLQPLGVEIATACDGAAALAAAQAAPFDVIFMDVRMPELDGREATRRIRAGEGPNRSTPVIAVTADTDKDDVEACRAAGMDWFVGKPIEPARLLDILGQALNAASPEPQAEDEGAVEEDEGRPLRVLVADDHEINRRAVQLVLEPAGAQVTCVADGLAAFEAAQTEAFDLIVMDVRMPEMNGHEATRRIRETPGPNQHVPVIAVTAEADAQACLAAGMNLFVGKPIDPATLMAAVVQVLDAANANEGEAEGREVA
jgi:CheY-like chemotaxis protein/signal transduction histidine kinase